ncbi:MAG: VanW family protein [Clostridia bacterium]|nr:VanW family protein [Bacilli bacterium]MBR2705456.1 VanW family protein [Clostridia bacterium]
MEKLEKNLPTENEAQTENKVVEEKNESTEQAQEKENKQISNEPTKTESTQENDNKKVEEKKEAKKAVPFDKKKVEEFFKNKDSEKKTKNPQTSVNDTMQLKTIKNKNGKKKLIVALIVLALLLSILSTAFGIGASFSNKVVNGISVNGIDVSNLTKQEALSKLSEQLKDEFNKDIILTKGEFSTTIAASDIEAAYNLEESVDAAYNIGRSGSNIFVNNFDVIKSLIKKKDITPSIQYNDQLLDEKLDQIDREMPGRVINSNYKIEDNNLIITSGFDGYRIVRDEIKKSIKSGLATNNLTIEIPVEQFHTDDVDIDAIYQEVYKEPKDATFNADPYELHKEENGLDFAITLDEARAMVADRQDTYTIPLKVLKPKITVKDLPQEAFPDQLATYSTTYASSNYNRSTNISIAANTVNGTVLMPGETFSYNETLGQRTTAKGYREAGAYVNGQVSTEVGGGICQVSSTLYNAALLCNLEIVARTNHSFEPAYVPAGQDATVSWRSPDFQFKNNREYPIKLVASAGGGRVTFTIYGVKSDNDYEVKIQSSKTGTIPFSTQYVNDDSLPVGTTKVTQSGSNGCRSVTYKILYKDGQEVSRTLINSDTYNPHNQVVAKGTKPVEVQPDPTPDPVQEPDNNDSTSEPSVEITNEPQE